MSRRSPSRILALFILLALCVAAVIMFRGAGRWLIREDPLQTADAIVVLSGSMPARAEEAAKIFRSGYAPEVWVSQPASVSGELQEMGIHYVGEADYNRQVLIQEGVPTEDVRILPDPISDTEEEVEEIGREMRREGRRSVIIVTSREHTRRVHTLWRKLIGASPAAIVHGAQEDPFDADHWWRNTRDTFSVFREMMGLLNAWLGLPVRPGNM
jgi:uncharacterized SAM-binding protein YcdF (DUF218 family)